MFGLKFVAGNRVFPPMQFSSILLPKVYAVLSEQSLDPCSL